MYIYGASGHAKVIAEIAEQKNVLVEGFIDDNRSIKTFGKYSVSDSKTLVIHELIIAIGNNEVRKRIASKYFESSFPTLTHPKSTVSKSALLGAGTVVMAGATINSEAKVGEHCIINTNSSIDHECIIENFVHISPNVALAGNVIVGEGTSVGVGSAIIQNIVIGKWCVIGAGSVIIKDIPDFAVVVGNPGKIIKYNFPL